MTAPGMNAELKAFPLVYLATPYTKYAEGIWPAYKEAARLAGLLVAQGIPIFSPIAHSHPLAIYAKLNPLDWQMWMKACEPFCQICGALIVARMDGWRESAGVTEEIKIFQTAGKPVYSLDPVTLAIGRGCE